MTVPRLPDRHDQKSARDAAHLFINAFRGAVANEALLRFQREMSGR